MTAFTLVKLDDLCEINIGRTPSRNVRDNWGVGEPWLSIADMNQGRNIYRTKEQITAIGIRDANMRLVPKGTVLLSFKLSIGKVSIAQVPLYTNEAIAALPIKQPEYLSTEYLYWCLRGIDLTLGQDRAAMGLTLNKAKLQQIQIPLPPMHVQRRIAAILDQADALRAKRLEALAHLDGLTQSIFIEMFGDPSSNPQQWSFVTLNDLVRKDDTINYGVVQPGDDVDEGIPLVRVGDVVEGNFDSKFLKKIDPSVEAAYKRSRLKGDEILVTCVGSIGVVAIAEPSMKGFNIARAVARVPVSDGTDRTFLASYLQTDFVQRYFTSELRTVSQPTLNIKQICETKVIQPPLKAQKSFATRIQSVEALKATHRATLHELDSLFASLQHRAFAGEL